MCSYNAVNGKPACASPELLRGTLRRDLGFTGVIVSDCGAVDSIFNLHQFTKCARAPGT
jgi:beta-glucosidase-like glycosyl hydrolase